MARPQLDGKGVTQSVRPDRMDLRDRKYQPPLVALPPEYPANAFEILKKYKPLVKDQGVNGPCTGYALAVMINFLRWAREWRPKAMMGVPPAELPDPKDMLLCGALLASMMLRPEVAEVQNCHATDCNNWVPPTPSPQPFKR